MRDGHRPRLRSGGLSLFARPWPGPMRGKEESRPADLPSVVASVRRCERHIAIGRRGASMDQRRPCNMVPAADRSPPPRSTSRPLCVMSLDDVSE